MLLAHEMIKAKNSVIEFTIGELVSPETVSSMNLSLKQHAKLFRKHLYKISKGRKGIYKTEQCIAHPESRQIIKQELKYAERIGITAENIKIWTNMTNTISILYCGTTKTLRLSVLTVWGNVTGSCLGWVKRGYTSMNCAT